MNNPPFRQTLGEPALVLAVGFCLALRIAFHFLYGLSYDWSVIWWQMLDPELLRREPFQAIYQMHMQPPLLNALYAGALALGDAAGPAFLQVLFVGCSLLMVAIAYWFLRRFGYGAPVAGAAAALLGVLPQVLLYENVYFYSHIEATLVLCAMLCAARYLEGGALRSFAGFAAAVAALGLLRSLFHVGWVAVALLVVWLLARRRHGAGGRALMVGLAAIAVVSSVYLKNLREFGIFAASSWEGVTLVNMLTPSLPGDNVKFAAVQEDLARRVARGEFSRSMTAAMQSPDVWHGWVVLAKNCDDGPEKRPPLCEIERSNGELNFNHIALLGYSRDLGRDAPRLLRLYPQLYLHHVASSVMTFLGTPSWDYRTMSAVLPEYAGLWNRLLLYRPGASLGARAGPASWLDSALNRFASSSLPLMAFAVFGSATVFLRGLLGGLACWRGRQARADWLFPALVLGLFVVVPNVLNGVEAQRIRYSVEPMLFIAVLAGLRRNPRP